MKIGIFTDTYEPLISGVVVSIKSLKEGLENLGHEVYIITSESVPKKISTIEIRIIRLPGIRFYFKILKGFRYVYGYYRYLPLINKLQLDIIHIHTEFSVGFLGLYIQKKLKLPMVYTIHTMYHSFVKNNKSFLFKFKYFQKFLLRYFDSLFNKFINRADKVIVPSQKVLNFVQNNYQIEGDYHIIPTQLNLKSFDSENYSSTIINSLKQKLNLTNMFVCLYVGRLSEEKEIDYLIQGFAFFLLDNPNSKFLIIGDGPIRNKLEQQVKKLNIVNNIIFLGFIPYEKLGLYYQLGNVFLSASLFETQGLTYIEALAAALPLVARYDVVLEKVIVHGKNGFFFHSPQELVTILTDLYHNPNKCQNLSQQAKLSILKYNSKDFAKKVLNVYQKAIKKSSTKILI
ncbi:MAG: glycosyltransferase [Candidatus Phytoplasma pyri]